MHFWFYQVLRKNKMSEGGKAAAQKQGPHVPEFVQERMAKCDNIEYRKHPIVEKPIKVTLPDGKVVDGMAGKTTPYEIAAGISKGWEAVVVYGCTSA